MAFLHDPFCFHVAPSRARRVVIVVASSALFDADCCGPVEMSWANGHCRYRELASLVDRFAYASEAAALKANLGR
jgi:hypothetical protein